MSARIYVHPKCRVEPGYGRLMRSLESQGFNPDELWIFKGELVRKISERDMTTTYESMNGQQFTYCLEQITPLDAA